MAEKIPKPPCPVCGSQSVFHEPYQHTFAYRRKIAVLSRRRYETTLHELLKVFPDLAPLHARTCKRKH